VYSRAKWDFSGTQLQNTTENSIYGQHSFSEILVRFTRKQHVLIVIIRADSNREKRGCVWGGRHSKKSAPSESKDCSRPWHSYRLNQCWQKDAQQRLAIHGHFWLATDNSKEPPRPLRLVAVKVNKLTRSQYFLLYLYPSLRVTSRSKYTTRTLS
jgi:hypothetical protein